MDRLPTWMTKYATDSGLGLIALRRILNTCPPELRLHLGLPVANNDHSEQLEALKSSLDQRPNQISIKLTMLKELHSLTYHKESLMPLVRRTVNQPYKTYKGSTVRLPTVSVEKISDTHINTWIGGKKIKYQYINEPAREVYKRLHNLIDTLLMEAGILNENHDPIYEQDKAFFRDQGGLRLDSPIEKATPSTEPLDPLYEQDRHIKF